MTVFEAMSAKDHEQVLFCYDKASGLRAIIAIHNTILGPALGGCRLWHYDSEADALRDALRLSRGMTYKAAVAGLNLGGGKTVIMADSKGQKTESLFRCLGRFVDSLAGRYITAEDVGTSVRDMAWVRMETRHVTGLAESEGGLGDPSTVTAWGVYHGMRAALRAVFGSDKFEGRSVAVQGLGHVGGHLVGHLMAAEAKVIATDVDASRMKKIKDHFPRITLVAPEEIYDVACDVFAPCAMGGSVNQKTIPRLRCQIIAGSANNVLEHEEVDSLALDKRILYVPDFVINAGGLINVANELAGHDRKVALAQAARIFDIVENVLNIAKQENITTHQAAMTLAERRIESIRSVKRFYREPCGVLPLGFGLSKSQ